jgi:mono/diheme cytochrome c family protein
VRRAGSIIAALSLALLAETAAAQSIARGREASEQWCASCHVVSGQTRGSDAVPSFERIANDANFNDDRLRGFLNRPHPPMPPLQISRSDIDSFVLYFRSLRR